MNEALPPIARYKISYHADEWGQRSSTPGGIPDHAGSWVRYADHVAALVEAELAAIGAGGVSGPLMGEQSAPKVSDAQRALHELILNRLSHAELLEKAHYLMELNSNQGRTIGELQDLVALTAQAPNQPGGFSSGDMASAAAQGYRDGWAAAQADSVQEDAALLTSEQEYAIRQGHEIAASDGYFDARPQIESKDRRKVFQAGFERGWDAARKQGANHD